ncbi:MAG: hypothetical protein AAF333_02410 [Planctomycetota bacterium]
MSPGPHLAAALLAAAVVLLAGCDRPEALVNVDSEKEANAILVELERHGVTGVGKTATTANRQTVWAINVPAGQASAARQILVQLDLPRNRSAGMEDVLENTGLIPTRTDERVRLMHAVAGELETTFMAYDGVVQARVHVAIPDEQVAFASSTAPPPRPTATVVIKHVGETPPVTAEEVQQITARGVEELDPPDVYVAFTRASTAVEITPVLTADGQPVAAADGYPPLVYQLFGVCVVFGLIILALLFALVRKGKAAPRSAPPTRPGMTSVSQSM